MRMYGYVKEPFKTNKKDTIYKTSIIHDLYCRPMLSQLGVAW